MEGRRSLLEIVRDCEQRWMEEYVQEARNGATDAQLNLADMLIHGSGGRPPQTRDAIDLLIKASRRSAEAAYKLGKIYLNGKYITQDQPEATFYLKLATLFKCKCGKLEVEYHTHQISNAHPCYTTEAKELLDKLNINPEIDSVFKERFSIWKHNRNRN